MRIGVVGAGAFGTALAITQSAAGRDVTLWCRSPDQARQMNETGRNDTRLPTAKLPKNLRISAEIETICELDILLLAIPAQTLSSWLDAYSSRLRADALVACCKGIDLTTGLGPVDLIGRCSATGTPLILTGPGFASDLADGTPTAMTLATEQMTAAKRYQQALSTPALRLYASSDPIGVQLCGALKNVYAIGCGAIIASGLGESARAAFLTRAISEMRRVVQNRGGEPATANGLSGLGDLILTATSDKSRNYRFGRALLNPSEDMSGTTVEGVPTTRAIHQLAEKEGLDLPLCSAVLNLIDGTQSIQALVDHLLARPLKEE